MAVKAKLDSGERIVFLDVENQKAYLADGSELDSNVATRIMSFLLNEQAESAFNMPYEKISEVMDTERKLAEENNKHIFRSF
jgi:hypothetical protein